MALNSAMHEIYLSMPIEASLLPELQGLPFWARMTHEIMNEVNPGLLKDLALANKLDAYLKKQQEQLSSEARRLEKEWRRANPLKPEADYFQRSSWQNHSKQSARETLIQELTKSLAVHALEQ